MLTRIESIKEKNKRITELKLEQLVCAEEALKIAKKGASKYGAVTLKRAFRIMGWALKAKQINMQIQIVQAQPYPPSAAISSKL